MLTNAGLTVTSTSTDYSDNIAEGNVISQSIAKDQSVDEGTNISLVISLGSRVTKYYCNAKITAPDSSEVKSADITLRDASGQVLQIWSGIDIGKFPTPFLFPILRVLTGEHWTLPGIYPTGRPRSSMKMSHSRSSRESYEG